MQLLRKSLLHERFWLSFIVLYFFSFGLQFLYLDAFFWDDWLRGDSLYSLYAAWENNGIAPGRGFIEFSVLRNSPVLFHLVTMVCFFVSASISMYIAADNKLNMNEGKKWSLRALERLDCFEGWEIKIKRDTCRERSINMFVETITLVFAW